MKKTMTKLGVLAFLGLSLAAYAQEGKVGINTENPKATLDITAYKTDGSTKEGLLIPRLTKEAISKITDPETSTLVYVNDVAYTPGTDANADLRVSEVDAVGFHYYNGTKWVRQDKYEWDRKTEDGIDKIYLKNALPTDEISYRRDKGYYKENFGGGQTDEFKLSGVTYKENEIPKSLFIRSSKLPDNSTMNEEKNFFAFQQNHAVIDQAHAGKSEDRVYKGSIFGLITSPDVSTTLKDGTALVAVAQHTGPGNVKKLFGASAYSSLGSDDNTNYSTAKSITGSYSNAAVRGNGNADEITGLSATAYNLGKRPDRVLNLMTGIYADASSNIPGVKSTITTMRGADVQSIIKDKAEVLNSSALRAITHLQKGGKLINGIGVDIQSHIDVNAQVVEDYTSLNSYVSVSAPIGKRMKNLYGLRSNFQYGTEFIALNNYGIYLDVVRGGENSNYGIYLNDVRSGTTNYAIYTNAGKVRFGDAVAVGSNSTTPAATLDVNGYIKVGSTDTTSDTNPQAGMIKFNASTKKFQGYNGTAWVDLN